MVLFYDISQHFIHPAWILWLTSLSISHSLWWTQGTKTWDLWYCIFSNFQLHVGIWRSLAKFAFHIHYFTFYLGGNCVSKACFHISNFSFISFILSLQLRLYHLHKACTITPSLEYVQYARLEQTKKHKGSKLTLGAHLWLSENILYFHLVFSYHK